MWVPLSLAAANLGSNGQGEGRPSHRPRLAPLHTREQYLHAILPNLRPCLNVTRCYRRFDRRDEAAQAIVGLAQGAETKVGVVLGRRGGQISREGGALGPQTFGRTAAEGPQIGVVFDETPGGAVPLG